MPFIRWTTVCYVYVYCCFSAIRLHAFCGNCLILHNSYCKLKVNIKGYWGVWGSFLMQRSFRSWHTHSYEAADCLHCRSGIQCFDRMRTHSVTDTNTTSTTWSTWNDIPVSPFLIEQTCDLNNGDLSSYFPARLIQTNAPSPCRTMGNEGTASCEFIHRSSGDFINAWRLAG